MGTSNFFPSPAPYIRLAGLGPDGCHQATLELAETTIVPIPPSHSGVRVSINIPSSIVMCKLRGASSHLFVQAFPNLLLALLCSFHNLFYSAFSFVIASCFSL